MATIVNKTSDSDKEVTPPEWITRRDLQAAFRKLPAGERERLEALPDDKRRGAVQDQLSTQISGYLPPPPGSAGEPVPKAVRKVGKQSV